MAAIIDSLGYDERRMARDTLGVQVHVDRTGSVNAQGPRWVVTTNPGILGSDILFGSA